MPCRPAYASTDIPDSAAASSMQHRIRFVSRKPFHVAPVLFQVLFLARRASVCRCGLLAVMAKPLICGILHRLALVVVGITKSDGHASRRPQI